MSEIFALCTGLILTAVAVSAGGLALEVLFVVFSRTLRQDPGPTHRELWPPLAEIDSSVEHLNPARLAGEF